MISKKRKEAARYVLLARAAHRELQKIFYHNSLTNPTQPRFRWAIFLPGPSDERLNACVPSRQDLVAKLVIPSCPPRSDEMIASS